MVIEPINPRNVPGYFLNDFFFARDLIRELKIPNLKLQFDIYHCQIIHGDVTMHLREMMPDDRPHPDRRAFPRATNPMARS